MGPLMINMAFMPLYMWGMWDVTCVTHGRTGERTLTSRAVFSLSWIRNFKKTPSKPKWPAPVWAPSTPLWLQVLQRKKRNFHSGQKMNLCNSQWKSILMMSTLWDLQALHHSPPPLLQMCHIQSITSGASWTNNACLAAKTAPKRRVDRMWCDW